MELRLLHNKLFCMEELGFNVTWKLILIGLHGAQYIPAQITYDDVFEYLNEYLCRENVANVDSIISVINADSDYSKADKIIEALSEHDKADFLLQLRKWRVYLLQSLLDNSDKDYMQGLLELMEFWVTLMGAPEDCPIELPSNTDTLILNDYFTEDKYNALIKENKAWIGKEKKTIIEEEEASGVINVF